MDNISPGSKLTYIKSLDGLRGIACLMVVFFHSPVPMFQFQFGWAGVNLFFILSGFLITRILINVKHHPLKAYLKSFYLRRTLRIFPLYFFYLLLAFSCLLLLNHVLAGHDEIIKQGVSDFKRNYPFLFTYTYNFEGLFNFLTGKDYHNSMFTGHLWTLSVEEQFYLLFPLAVYFLPRRILKGVCLFIIFFIPVLRLIFVLVLKEKITDFFWIGDMLYVSTVFQLDALSLGVSLVIFDLRCVLKHARLYLGVIVVLIVITGILHLSYYNAHGMNMPLSSLGYDAPVYHVLMTSPNEILNNRYFYSIPLLNFAFALIMLLVINGRMLSQILESKLLVWVGKISYGVYIYHLGISYLFSLAIIKPFNQYASSNIFTGILLMAVYLFILITISFYSYKKIELPFLIFKRFFFS